MKNNQTQICRVGLSSEELNAVLIIRTFNDEQQKLNCVELLRLYSQMSPKGHLKAIASFMNILDEYGAEHKNNRSFPGGKVIEITRIKKPL